MSHEKHITDKNGIQYIFAIWKKDEFNIFRWEFMRHRFQINENTAQICGDFITSMWFSQENPTNAAQEFLIVGIKDSFNYNRITGLVNGAFASRQHHRLTETEKMQGIVLKEHFILSVEDIIKFTTDNKVNESNHIQICGKNDILNLTLLIRNFGKSVYISLPSFCKTL
jgi:hypothetical protein